MPIFARALRAAGNVGGRSPINQVHSLNNICLLVMLHYYYFYTYLILAINKYVTIFISPSSRVYSFL